jgi:hypothetical protein
MTINTRPGLSAVNRFIAKLLQLQQEVRQLSEATFGAGIEPDEEQIAEFERIGVLVEGAAMSLSTVAKTHGIDLTQYLNRGH